jgi:hypothetical protein
MVRSNLLPYAAPKARASLFVPPRSRAQTVDSTGLRISLQCVAVAIISIHAHEAGFNFDFKKTYWI